MRTFIAIEIPEKIKKEIAKIQEQLPEFRGKKTEPENLHLTLKFLGEVDEYKIEKIKEKLREIKDNVFETEIDSIGVFSEKFIKIVWIHMKNCDALQKQIDSKLEKLFEKEKRFMSHLTIARVKSVKDKKIFLNKINRVKFEPIFFNVDHFSLKKSILTEEKPFYEDIEVYNLKI